MPKCEVCLNKFKYADDMTGVVLLLKKDYEKKSRTRDDVTGFYELCNGCFAEAEEHLGCAIDANDDGEQFFIETEEFWEWLAQPKEEQLQEMKDEVEKIHKALARLQGTGSDPKVSAGATKARKGALATSPKPDETVIDLSEDD